MSVNLLRSRRKNDYKKRKVNFTQASGSAAEVLPSEPADLWSHTLAAERPLRVSC